MHQRLKDTPTKSGTFIPDVALELRDESSNGKKSTTYTRNA
jgi:hypothetical protein